MRTCLPFSSLAGATYGDSWELDPFLKPFDGGNLYGVLPVVFLYGGDSRVVEVHNDQADDDRHP